MVPADLKETIMSRNLRHKIEEFSPDNVGK